MVREIGSGFVPRFDGAINHEVGLPNNESCTERNIHKSQRLFWTANELHTGISALSAVVITLTRFMDVWKDAFADEEDATSVYCLSCGIPLSY